jgi:phospholipid/cholesterol/gamma-HCH transport system substrate-binding protein
METRANYVLIGAFTLAVIVGVFGFVFWFQNIGGTGERAYYRVVFDGSVSGLRTGATVLFNGIRVGEVTDLRLNPQSPKQVIANIAINKSVAVRKDTEIGLEFQGLTGIASLSLKGGDPSAEQLAGSKDAKDENAPLLTAPPGATQDITQSARDVLRHLDEFLGDNQKTFKTAMENINTFTEALARNSDRIDKIVEGMQNLTAGEDGKSGEINDAVKALHGLADNGNKQITSLSAEARRTLGDIGRAVKDLSAHPSRLIFGGKGSSDTDKKN